MPQISNATVIQPELRPSFWQELPQYAGAAAGLYGAYQGAQYQKQMADNQKFYYTQAALANAAQIADPDAQKAYLSNAGMPNAQVMLTPDQKNQSASGKYDASVIDRLANPPAPGGGQGAAPSAPAPDVATPLPLPSVGTETNTAVAAPTGDQSGGPVAAPSPAPAPSAPVTSQELWDQAGDKAQMHQDLHALFPPDIPPQLRPDDASVAKAVNTAFHPQQATSYDDTLVTMLARSGMIHSIINQKGGATAEQQAQFNTLMAGTPQEREDHFKALMPANLGPKEAAAIMSAHLGIHTPDVDAVLATISKQDLVRGEAALAGAIPGSSASTSLASTAALAEKGMGEKGAETRQAAELKFNREQLAQSSKQFNATFEETKRSHLVGEWQTQEQIENQNYHLQVQDRQQAANIQHLSNVDDRGLLNEARQTAYNGLTAARQEEATYARQVESEAKLSDAQKASTMSAARLNMQIEDVKRKMVDSAAAKDLIGQKAASAELATLNAQLKPFMESVTQGAAGDPARAGRILDAATSLARAQKNSEHFMGQLNDIGNQTQELYRDQIGRQGVTAPPSERPPIANADQFHSITSALAAVKTPEDYAKMHSAAVAAGKDPTAMDKVAALRGLYTPPTTAAAPAPISGGSPAVPPATGIPAPSSIPPGGMQQPTALPVPPSTPPRPIAGPPASNPAGDLLRRGSAGGGAVVSGGATVAPQPPASRPIAGPPAPPPVQPLTQDQVDAMADDPKNASLFQQVDQLRGTLSKVTPDTAKRLGIPPAMIGQVNQILSAPHPSPADQRDYRHIQAATDTISNPKMALTMANGLLQNTSATSHLNYDDLSQQAMHQVQAQYKQRTGRDLPPDKAAFGPASQAVHRVHEAVTDTIARQYASPSDDPDDKVQFLAGKMTDLGVRPLGDVFDHYMVDYRLIGPGMGAAQANLSEFLVKRGLYTAQEFSKATQLMMMHRKQPGLYSQ